ncbi:DUF484 family protein [Spiribacter vilamensis]|uniref:DUF484 family protein n=1 Tax=Spiribacter vilamensis TaxID=531306 RepID=A0A4Q8D285_9GAMM|nr:DUF484 family protein [Spiribacter vilamensis]RZU99498.1 hypothetical protein EV698_1790 [Spiribacter vilamensis]TVO61529.1 DUF484 family protein [Spiribacter vilamensis]
MSGQTGESAMSAHPIDEQAVLDYLQAHPDLLQRHPDLVSRLEVPHPTGGVTSLIEYQVSILREENHALAERLDQLLQVARDNDRLVEQIHRFTLELLAADDLDSVLVAIRDGLRHDFRADVVEVILIGEWLSAAGAPVLAPDDPRAQQLESALAGDQPVLGELDAEHRTLIFGDQAEGLGSVAVIPMDEPPVRGFIAIGSRDADRYHDEQGTIFLGQLGALAARVLRRSCAGP